MMTIEALKALTPDRVMSVYNGRAGKCCCGCVGRHSYNSQMVEAAAKDRGYPIDPTDVSDRRVARILRTVQNALAVSPPEDAVWGEDSVMLDVGTRRYLVQFAG